MTRKSIGTFAGLGLVVIAACTGGGVANDFQRPNQDAPTDPGATRDPSAPPSSTTEPPFGDVAPPPNDQPPGGGGCNPLCTSALRACPNSNFDEVAECVAECEDLSTACPFETSAYIRCVIASGCEDAVEPCERQLVTLIECLGPEPPDGGEGGQGGN